ncbi:MAG TPA: SpoIVB peptidase S55 domain-containing protein, partial [Candidatus Angelobacter sp.]|nr:SpoIVB peptidase S55 domain-containing protein [Candidatus Angelobacter sp.]
MKKSVLSFAAALLFATFVSAQATSHIQPSPAQAEIVRSGIMKPEEVRPGMKGVAYTVFQGTRPEPMGVEVLGVLRNLNGPRSSTILVRLTGEKPEYTGVVAGMSGSPVYIDGKLLGALAYRIGSFSKEPIAGITPITEMLEINELDQSVPPPSATATQSPAVRKTSGPGVSEAPDANYAQYLQPIDSPFVFNGFSESALKQFSSQFASAGIVPVMGVGASSGEKQPEPLVPGSAVSAIL